MRHKYRLGALTLLVLTAESALASSPAGAVAAAASDLAARPPGSRTHVRYLSLYAVPEKQWADFRKVLAFQINSLSREAVIVPPAPAAPDLVVVNLADYRWDAAVWERFRTVEPYFHAGAVLTADAAELRYWPGGVDAADGRHYGKGLYKVSHQAGDRVIAAAPWLPVKEILFLRKGCYTEVPIVRADWFLSQTAISADRVAGYYDFLGLGKKEADFEKLIGANRDVSRKVGREVAAILARSGVTVRNRSITRFQGATGGYWVTQDFRTSVKRQNVIRFLDADLDPPQGDASERYGFLPNGLFAYWLQNKDGVRQDTAPDFIASDRSTASTDGRVHAGKSCVVCHVEGLRPIDDYARRIYRGAVALQEPDHAKFVRLRQLYLADLEKWLKRDRAEYAEAVAEATGGWKTAELAKAYGRAWDAYVETDLSPADAAREMGVVEKELVASLKKLAAAPPRGLRGKLDTVLAGLIQEPPVPVLREHWEEVFALAMANLKGLDP